MNKTKLPDPAIFILAAQLLADKEETYCCIALSEAIYRLRREFFCSSGERFSLVPEFILFRKLYAIPALGDKPGVPWFKFTWLFYSRKKAMLHCAKVAQQMIDEANKP